MIEDIYDPLDEYINVFKDRFKDVCESTFAQLAAESGVDVEANRQTCAEIEQTRSNVSDVNRQISRWNILCVLLWAAFAVGVAAILLGYVTDPAWRVGVGIAALLPLWPLLAKVHPTLNRLKAEHSNLEAFCASLLEKAWQQMSPLNRLYDWEIFTRMMTQTVPRLEFDPFFTTQRLADLKAIYGWDESFNAERSVLYSHSGLINGNPFVICRTKKMEWGHMEYTGELTIYWTEEVRGSDGKYHIEQRSETLTATISRPYPEYFEKTRLIYGNTAAPDLKFYRWQNSSFETSKVGRWVKKKNLRQKARDLVNADYAMMTNEEFEVAFDTSNRNNNQQFALLFTPLAQNSMMKILNDTETGYGDDFDFKKSNMINVIFSNHMQGENMDMNPEQYQNYSFDLASEDFYRINAAHFRAIYFAFAPLLAVPMYQQIRSHENIYGRDMKRESAYWEHEALANFWGIGHFAHPDCVTDCILKTAKISSLAGGTDATIQVKAYGYRGEPRVTYVEKYGGDGRYHKIPVHWTEYIPVTGTGTFDIKEDHLPPDTDATQTQRINRIQSTLTRSGHTLYRRSIFSRL